MQNELLSEIQDLKREVVMHRANRVTRIALVALVFLTFQPAYAQTETVLYSFAGTPDGAHPSAALVIDSEGNLYGTAMSGGHSGNGCVFNVTSSLNENIVHSFTGESDGATPYGGLVRKGSFYGTTTDDGAFGYGTVFKLTPTGKLTTLYNFKGGADGGNPLSTLIIDRDGNLYGTTQSGGVGFGTVFEVTPSGTETVLHRFTPSGNDGYTPDAGLVFDKLGNLYGTTTTGGTFGKGTVFEITVSGAESVLYSFAGGSDGAAPAAALALDKHGNLYGTTTAGGSSNLGIVYKLTPSGTETILHTFTGPDGADPWASVVLDKTGNLYGTTSQGGKYNGGTVFKVSMSGSETVLYNFNPDTGDGYFPLAGLSFDQSGNLYGTTQQGGIHNDGTVFMLSP